MKIGDIMSKRGKKGLKWAFDVSEEDVLEWLLNAVNFTIHKLTTSRYHQLA